MTVTGPDTNNTVTYTNYITATIDPASVATPNFTYTPSSGAAPLEVTFTNTSTGTVTSQSWNFGDGATSTEASPQHTYATPGTYQVSLSVSGPFGSGTKQASVTVYPPVTASFTATPTQGIAPLQVSFTNTTQSYRTITGYLWDFGDGTTSTEANPVHTYSSSGSYSVTLTASVTGGQDGETKANYITAFSPQPIFKDGFESGNFSQWTANLSDGGDLSVTPAAALTGSYGLQALLDDNTAIYVTDDSPNAEKRYMARFYFDPNSIGMANNNSHYIFLGYQGASTYILILDFRYTTTYGYQIRAFTVLDNATTATTAWFTIADHPTFIELDWLAASAAGSNNGALSLWINGVQKASLTGLDNDTRVIDRARLGALLGIDTETRGAYYFDEFEASRNNYIGFEPNQADFSASPLTGKAPLLVSFSNLSQPLDAGNSYLWDFGDGATSTEANPQHTYLHYGDHTVSLTVSGPRGTDTKTRSAYIQLPELIFTDGFESADLSQWSASVPDGGDLSVSAAAALMGSQGLQITLNDNNSVYLVDESPTAEKRYRARFYFDPNSITMASANSHYLFLGYPATGSYILLLDFRYMSGYGYQARVFTVLDNATTATTSWVTLSDQPHYLEFDWQAASAVNANDGHLAFWVDGLPQGNLTGLDNDTRLIERVRLGAVLGIDTGTRGSYYFDAFQSGRGNYIDRAGYLADFSATPQTGKAPLAVTFNNLTKPVDASSTYLWDFGDGATSSEFSPIHTYTSYGSYTVSLTVNGSRGTDIKTRVDYIYPSQNIFSDGFESGNLSNWTSSVVDGNDLNVTNAAALAGSYGLEVTIDDNTPIYLSDDSPNAEKRYRVSYNFDPNSIVMASGNNHYILLGYQGNTPYILIQDFRYMAGIGYQLKLSTVLDSGAAATTTWFTISDQPHFIEFDWQASSAVGANNGALTLWIDGVQKAKLSGLDNDTRQIDRARLGACLGIDTETRGTYFIDGFVATR